MENFAAMADEDAIWSVGSRHETFVQESMFQSKYRFSSASKRCKNRKD